jgi:hypothetical protein
VRSPPNIVAVLKEMIVFIRVPLGPHSEPFRNALLGWSSGTWSKARGRATIGLDQFGLDSCVDPDSFRIHRAGGKDHDKVLDLVMCRT